MKTVLRTAHGLLLAGALAVTAVVPVHSAIATPCAPRDAMIGELATNLQQKHRAIGLTQAGILAELVVSTDRRWTLIVASPEGFSCVIAAGHDWNYWIDPVPEA